MSRSARTAQFLKALERVRPTAPAESPAAPAGCSHGHPAHRRSKRGDCLECQRVRDLRRGSPPRRRTDWTGITCKHGHNASERSPATGACRACRRERDYADRTPGLKSPPIDPLTVPCKRGHPAEERARQRDGALVCRQCDRERKAAKRTPSKETT